MNLEQHAPRRRVVAKPALYILGGALFLGSQIGTLSSWYEDKIVESYAQEKVVRTKPTLSVASTIDLEERVAEKEDVAEQSVEESVVEPVRVEASVPTKPYFTKPKCLEDGLSWCAKSAVVDVYRFLQGVNASPTFEYVEVPVPLSGRAYDRKIGNLGGGIIHKTQEQEDALDAVLASTPKRRAYVRKPTGKPTITESLGNWFASFRSSPEPVKKQLGTPHVTYSWRSDADGR